MALEPFYLDPLNLSTGTFLIVGIGTFRIYRSRAFFNAHLLKTVPSELQLFTPISTYRASYSGPIIANSIAISVPA